MWSAVSLIIAPLMYYTSPISYLKQSSQPISSLLLDAQPPWLRSQLHNLLGAQNHDPVEIDKDYVCNLATFFKRNIEVGVMAQLSPLLPLAVILNLYSRFGQEH